MKYSQSILLVLVSVSFRNAAATLVNENHRSATISGGLIELMDGIDLELTSSTEVHISTCGSTIDTTIAIKDTDSFNGWIDREYDDDNCGENGNNEDICIQLEEGQYTVHVNLHGSGMYHWDYATLTVNLDGCSQMSSTVRAIIGVGVSIAICCCCIAAMGKVCNRLCFGKKQDVPPAQPQQPEIVCLAQREGSPAPQYVQHAQMVPMQQNQMTQPQYGQAPPQYGVQQPQYAQLAQNIQPLSYAEPGSPHRQQYAKQPPQQSSMQQFVYNPKS